MAKEKKEKRFKIKTLEIVAGTIRNGCNYSSGYYYRS